jgi:hypothetical protein
MYNFSSCFTFWQNTKNFLVSESVAALINLKWKCFYFGGHFEQYTVYTV